jgi:hypothetical protein
VIGRPFAIASPPHESRNVDRQIHLESGGQATSRIHQTLSPGDATPFTARASGDMAM